MSQFFDQASLVMVPSGYKNGKVYSQKPLSADGQLAFTRTADTATRVGPDGLIQKVRTNLVLQSETFNTTWAVNGIVITANTAANPLTGTTTADTITADAANNFHYINQSITYAAGEVTVSVYVKANGYTWFLIDSSITDAFGYYNITTGVVGTKGSACTTSITDVGSGWYRCSVTFTATAGAANLNFSIRNADNGGNFLGDGVSGLFIYGAQAEMGVATDYIATTTAAVSVGPVANTPRLDYSGGATCPKLLLEGQRTNLDWYSEQFDNAYWEKGSVATITANSVISPDGTQNADTLTANGSGAIFVRINVYLGTPQTCSNSIFAKKANHSLVGLRNSGTTSAHDVFDFDTKTWTNNSGATLSYDELGNGWFRLKSTNTDAVNLNYYWSVLPAVDTSGLENTTASNLSVYIWGAQAEQNASYATSYIPTLGAAVTRGADSCLKTGISSLIGQTEGVVFVEAANLFPSGSRTIALLYTSGSAFYQVYINASNQVRVDVNGSFLFLGGSIAANTNYKIAFAYKSGEYALYINGTQIATSASTTMPSSLTAYYLGNSIGSEQSGAFSQALLLPTRLTNAQLAELTTI